MRGVGVCAVLLLALIAGAAAGETSWNNSHAGQATPRCVQKKQS